MQDDRSFSVEDEDQGRLGRSIRSSHVGFFQFEPRFSLRYLKSTKQGVAYRSRMTEVMMTMMARTSATIIRMRMIMIIMFTWLYPLQKEGEIYILSPKIKIKQRTHSIHGTEDT